ncbi:hypothetical protein [Streptomyces natalensis]|uniref:Uncharacterized protein n=1 Tax=Streptomyces natalensis ATCC 27448 TaxID=1240678 RepID=A0A0D7CN43_9ACTN|nr:hypothetical protein [Streptomyces natalensis]KIZ16837.1 hypothetical protein SNA_17720 [Streptomyces natalensis ATCC 27448]
MRVRVVKPFEAYWNYAVTTFNVDAELEGEMARHFADNAPVGCIEVLERDPEPKPEPAPAKAADPVQSEGDGPPVDGTIDTLMTWVDGDPGRAAQALEAEQAKDKPRSTVVKRLAGLADGEE